MYLLLKIGDFPASHVSFQGGMGNSHVQLGPSKAPTPKKIPSNWIQWKSSLDRFWAEDRSVLGKT